MSTPHHKKIHTPSVSVLVTTLLFVSLFFITKTPTPHTSELMFTEHSTLGKHAGSVIPASCDSAPPTSHFSGDCEPQVNMGVGSDLTSFTDINISISSKTALYQEHPTLTWSTSGYTTCMLNQYAEGALTTLTSGLSSTAYVTPYQNNSTGVQEVVYLLNCTNPPYKNDVKSVSVWYDFNPY